MKEASKLLHRSYTVEGFKKAAEEHAASGDLFTFAAPVIPVRTKGRTFGPESREAVARGAVIPVLDLEKAKYCAPYLFVAIQDEEEEVTDELVFDAAFSCIMAASFAGVPEVHFPVMGKTPPWVIARGAFTAMDGLEGAGFSVPDYRIIHP